MGKLWSLVEEWRREQHQFAPSYGEIAARLDISRSTFTGWKRGLQEMPKRRTLYDLHVLTGIDFAALVDASIVDAKLHDPARAKKAAEEWRRRKAEREAAAAANVTAVDFGGPDPAADLAADRTGERSQKQKLADEQDKDATPPQD